MVSAAELPGLRRFADRAARGSHGAGQRAHICRGIDVVRQRDSRDLCMVAGRGEVLLELVREEEAQQLSRRALVEDDFTLDIQ
ncbi:hypothetical protein CCUG63695_00580 [Mycobacteroides franklinii]|uniref:Uncharacterized protein n=1 Tax=Mycobacteroides franklinii TaxID=948102 RepID=A0A4R8R4E6_9MYCO|nr:hypothetical protein CCUG64054_01214 [Mycobacteroides franklinii]TDZ49059.1 hypothetical protein CCUG63697_03591 [Mycobacteroides franklinii]TDZ59240.1 hypothetical protein CCUG63696_01218 [Mycobacteroides franklinii]TDZ66754.1 hypothetical protein CCUG63695_00580 [Mycobacteroides franklinii]TDZ72677.1 hypothetical protein CCUG64056_01214 [Mycobacteroides franklinii]